MIIHDAVDDNGMLVQQQMTFEEAKWVVNLKNVSVTSPGTPVVESVVDLSNNKADVKATVMPTGSPTITQNAASEYLFTFPILKSLTCNHEYELIGKMTDTASNIIGIRVTVRCVR